MYVYMYICIPMFMYIFVDVYMRIHIDISYIRKSFRVAGSGIAATEAISWASRTCPLESLVNEVTAAAIHK